jgi:hypothetical protein
MQAVSNVARLTDTEIAIAQYRAAGRSVPEIAVAVGRSHDAVYRALRKPAVKVVVAEGRALELQPSYDLARSQVERSIAKLVEVRDADRTTDANRIRASLAIAELAMSLRKVVVEAVDLADVEGRLAELEADSTPVEEDPDDAATY